MLARDGPPQRLLTIVLFKDRIRFLLGFWFPEEIRIPGFRMGQVPQIPSATLPKHRLRQVINAAQVHFSMNKNQGSFAVPAPKCLPELLLLWSEKPAGGLVGNSTGHQLLRKIAFGQFLETPAGFYVSRPRESRRKMILMIRMFCSAWI